MRSDYEAHGLSCGDVEGWAEMSDRGFGDPDGDAYGSMVAPVGGDGYCKGGNGYGCGFCWTDGVGNGRGNQSRVGDGVGAYHAPYEPPEPWEL